MVLHYQEYGDKNATLIVFIHGAGVSSWMWDSQIRHFTDYHCVTVDLPEQGLSCNSENFSIRSSAERIIELITKIANGKKVMVIGFSLGAQVTIQMLSLKPNLINYAIINSALVRPIPYAKILIRPSIKLTFPMIRYKLFSKLQAKTLYLDKENFEKYYKESCLIKSDTLIRILEENMAFEIPNKFKKANGKILVTVGEREKSVMKKSASDIVSNNPNSIGIIIPDIGHGVSLAKPDLFNQMVKMWVEDTSLPKEVKVIE
ncbi:hydrolase [Bacillus sp. SA1-12]|uniref:alpha/beta fold hydrolase n=1 Tax=Bacillus sp. SA1-12 TaxID=1455638 RepID=UPI000624FEFC|nr:alpha/beta hydrolase [Bacillus sp. SA1-12]KKI91970.1 hydrolase [Bacillus sp. SA1-12]